MPSEPAPDAASATGEVHVRFEPKPGSMTLGAIPWPDDLYLDKDAHVLLSDLPGTPLNDYVRALREALPMLDGFGASTPVYFYLDGAIDPNSLPQSAEESAGPRASVFLIDADTGSPEAFQHVRVELQWSAAEQRLALRPALGHPLTPGRRYAALVTRRVKDSRGRPLEAAAKFAAVRDSSVALTDAKLVQASAEYTPVLETLVKAGMIAREDVVAMAVFRVQTTTPDLDAARRIVRAGKAPVASNLQFLDASALDGVFGVVGRDANAAAHDQLLGIVHGTLPSSNFVSATAKTHGAWQRDETGQLQLKRTEDVPFTLFIAKGSDPSPIVIYQHQRGRERSDAVFVANALARRNLSVLAIDAPFQGLRAKTDSARGVDTGNRFTGSDMPDRFGDVPGDFYGAEDTQGSLNTLLHPFYARDALRQGVVDLMTAVRFLDEGDLGSLGTTRKFDVRRVGFVGEDIGAQMALILAPSEPKLQALALIGPSAFVTQGFWRGATEQPLFAQLADQLGHDISNIDYDADSPEFWPELTLFETLLGRAEPLAYASALLRAPVNVFMQMAQDDETVANLATEALAVSLGATFLSNAPKFVGDLKTEPAVAGAVVSGNFAIDDDRVTRILRMYDPADHHMLLNSAGQHDYESAMRPPFTRRETPETFDNPSEAVRSHLTDYFASFFACVSAVNPATSAIKCGAAVTAP